MFPLFSDYVRRIPSDFPTVIFWIPDITGSRNLREVCGSRYGENPSGILLPDSGWISGRFLDNPVWIRAEFKGI